MGCRNEEEGEDNEPEPAIARRAYHIWEREGRPHGRDFDHWLAAERDLEGKKDRRREQRPTAAGAPAAPIKRKPPRPPTRKKPLA